MLASANSIPMSSQPPQSQTGGATTARRLPCPGACERPSLVTTPQRTRPRNGPDPNRKRRNTRRRARKTNETVSRQPHIQRAERTHLWPRPRGIAQITEPAVPGFARARQGLWLKPFCKTCAYHAPSLWRAAPPSRRDSSPRSLHLSWAGDASLTGALQPAAA